MEKRKKIIVRVAGMVFFILVPVLLGLHIYSYYQTEQTIYLQEVVAAFDESVRKDLEIREKVLTGNFVFGYASNAKSDSLTVVSSYGEKSVVRNDPNLKTDEKYIGVLQSILYKKNPLQVRVVDSLFHEELKLKKIKGKSAVILIDNILDTVYCSCTNINSLTPIFSTPVSIGAKKEISLQAYTEISSTFILSRMPKIYWMIILGWLLFIILLAIFIPYQVKRAKKQIAKEYVKQLLDFPSQQKMDVAFDLVEVEQEGLVGYPKHEQRIIPDELEISESISKNERVEELTEIEQNPKYLVFLAKDLNFNLGNNKLYFKGKVVTMTLKPAKLLRALLEAPNYFLSRKDLRKIVWENVSVSDEAIRQCISRLNERLSVSPDVRVVNLPGEGYRLHISKNIQDYNKSNDSSVKNVPVKSSNESTIEDVTDPLAKTSWNSLVNSM